MNRSLGFVFINTNYFSFSFSFLSLLVLISSRTIMQKVHFLKKLLKNFKFIFTEFIKLSFTVLVNY